MPEWPTGRSLRGRWRLIGFWGPQPATPLLAMAATAMYGGYRESRDFTKKRSVTTNGHPKKVAAVRFGLMDGAYAAPTPAAPSLLPCAPRPPAAAAFACEPHPNGSINRECYSIRAVGLCACLAHGSGTAALGVAPAASWPPVQPHTCLAYLEARR